MKKVLNSGYVQVDIIEDEYEGNTYKALELKITNQTTERVKLKSQSSYELLGMILNQQAKSNKQ